MKTAARIFTIFALVALLAAGAWADSRVRIVRLSYLQGDVSLDLGQGAGSQRAVLNMPIVEGARVWTGSDGQAEVEFEDGTTVRIAPNTTLGFNVLSLRDSGGRVNRLSVSGATAYVDVPRLQKEDEFSFELPNRVITVSHSVHFRIDMDGMEARLAVFKGELNVAGSERVVDIRKGETLTLSFNDTQRYNLANSIASLAYDSWDQDRYDTIREAGLNRNSQLYPYGYGYADLMNYGTFMNVGGSYGSCWRPYGVGAGWDPFDYGYWSYYPGFGYTWVSGYPWGWAPYRYGGWAWSNAGWSWCPRVNNVNNWYVWNVVPVVVNPPPRWHPPHRPDKPTVGLPPIIPVGRRGDAPYRGGLVSDKPGSGNNPPNAGAPEPGERRGSRGDPGIDSSHLRGGDRGAPPPTGPTVVVVPSDPVGSDGGGEERRRGPRPSRGIDLTPPGGAPGGRGTPSGGPIQSPVPVMRSPRPGPDGPSGDRGPRLDASRPGPSRSDSPRSVAPPPSAPSHMDSSHMSAPSEGPRMDSSPRMSAPASAPAPSSGGGGSRNRPPQ
jgi:hypothetical protein